MEPQLLQLRYRSQPWRMMVACILLNRTQRKQVDRVIDELFRVYPTATVMSTAGKELDRLLTSLGLATRRAHTLRRFSAEWGDYERASRRLEECYGIGRYAADSYQLFYLGNLIQPADKELRRWVQWKIGRLQEKT